MADLDLLTAANAAASTSEAKPEVLYIFQLYISDSNATAITAIANLKKLCDLLGSGLCTVEVIDVSKDPARAEMDRIFAIPTLVRSAPTPKTRILGDLGQSEKLFAMMRQETTYL